MLSDIVILLLTSCYCHCEGAVCLPDLVNYDHSCHHILHEYMQWLSECEGHLCKNGKSRRNNNTFAVHSAHVQLPDSNVARLSE